MQSTSELSDADALSILLASNAMGDAIATHGMFSPEADEATAIYFGLEEGMGLPPLVFFDDPLFTEG